jgi:hypothetical protein
LSYGCNQKDAKPIRIITYLQDFSNDLAVVQQLQNTRTGFFFRVFRVVRGSIWDGQPAVAGAISGA